MLRPAGYTAIRGRLSPRGERCLRFATPEIDSRKMKIGNDHAIRGDSAPCASWLGGGIRGTVYFEVYGLTDAHLGGGGT
jgi:hypothetical protein